MQNILAPHEAREYDARIQTVARLHRAAETLRDANDEDAPTIDLACKDEIRRVAGDYQQRIAKKVFPNVSPESVPFQAIKLIVAANAAFYWRSLD